MLKDECGYDYSSSCWLTNHYLAKSSQIIKNINTLPVNEGDKVLDLCCGPALYMHHLLGMAGEKGEVVGVDCDSAIIEYGKKHLSKTLFNNWCLIQSDIKDYKGYENFDVVMLFNGLSVLDDYYGIINFLLRKMKKGAKLIIKDFDANTTIFNPIDKKHHASYLLSIKNLHKYEMSKTINKFLGCKLHTVGHSIECSHHTSSVWTYIFKQPFSSSQVNYMSGIVANNLALVKHIIEQETLEYFKHFAGDDKGYFFKTKNAIFIENEHLVTLVA